LSTVKYEKQDEQLIQSDDGLASSELSDEDEITEGSPSIKDKRNEEPEVSEEDLINIMNKEEPLD
jgi:hypothetical protein